MGATRVYTPSLFVPAADGQSAVVTCDGGAIVETSTSLSAFGYANHRCGSLQLADFSPPPATVATTTSMLCIRGNGAPWRYATWAPSVGIFDRYAATSTTCAAPPSVSTVTIGYGVGALASFASIAAHCEPASTHVLLYTSAASTTSRSTGVAWWPLNGSAAPLMAAPGVDSNFLSTYASTAAAEISGFSLNWTVWPSPSNPVPPYRSNLTDFGFSHQLSDCGDGCGSSLLDALHARANASAASNQCALFVCIGTVTDVLASGSTHLVVSDNATFLSSAVVFGTGGTGHLLNETHVLANADNDGIHYRVADSLDLQKSAANLSWHLEFEYPGLYSRWSERWFPLTACHPDVTPYDSCADYSTRSLQLAAHGTNIDAVNVSDSSICDGTWWDDYFRETANLSLYSLPCPPQSVLAPGVIDRKDGFLINHTTMASITAPSLFAAGTASASLLGNTYYAPGATIGWGLYSGRIAGRSAATITTPAVPATRLEASTPLLLFVAAVCAMILGVTAHIVNFGKTHYVLMWLTVILVWTAAIMAATATPRRQPAGKTHRLTGWATATLITVTAILGSLRAAYRPHFNLTGYLHRMISILTLFVTTVHLLLITDEFSGGPDATMLYSEDFETFAAGAALLTFALGVWAIVRLRDRTIIPSFNKEIVWDFIDRNMLLIYTDATETKL